MVQLTNYTPSVFTLPCGCFFQGRKFFASGNCSDHSESTSFEVQTYYMIEDSPGSLRIINRGEQPTHVSVTAFEDNGDGLEEIEDRDFPISDEAAALAFADELAKKYQCDVDHVGPRT